MTANWSLQSWRGALSLALLLTSAQPAATPVVECRLPAQRQIYRLMDSGATREPRWWLAMSMPNTDRWIELPLREARVERAAGRLSLSSVSSNGGLAVQLTASAEQSVLDVFVNYELEVNVLRDLSPDAERMNTHGPVPDPACRVLSPD